MKGRLALLAMGKLVNLSLPPRSNVWAVRASVSQRCIARMARASIETVLREVPGMQRMLQGGFINRITDNSDSTFPHQDSSDINTGSVRPCLNLFF